MNWQDNKLEITVISATGLTLALFLSLAPFFQSSHHQSRLELNYEMARPKSSFAPEFDLAHREVLRSYVNPYAKKSKSVAAQKTVAQNKGLVTTKNKTVAAKKTTENKSKKSDIKVSVVEASHHKLGNETSDNSESNHFSNQNLTQNNEQKKNTQDTNKQDAEEVKNWKSLFASAPTQKLMFEFVQAYQNKKVTDALYYDVVKNLMLSQNTENQNIGLYGLRAFSTIQSYTVALQLANFPEVQKNPTLESSLSSYLISFNQKTKLGILEQALRSQDQEIVIRTTQIISEGMNALKNGTQVAFARDQRTQASTLSVSTYQRFVPTLQLLQSSVDQDVVQAATVVLTQIQSLNVAQNP